MSTQPKEITKQHTERRAVAYCRQSTAKQVEQNQGSTEDQRTQVRYAQEWGWPPELIEVNDDDLGLSGTATDHRPGYLRLRGQIEADQVGLVCVSDLSRLSRDQDELWTFLKLCRTHDTLIAASGKIVSLNDAAEIFNQRVMTSVMEFENARRRDGMVRGKMAKLEKGIAISIPPAGYVRGKDKEWQLDPDPLVQTAIRSIFRTFLEQRSLKQTVVALNRAGVRIPRRSKHGFLRWVLPKVATVAIILHHPAYLGDYVYRRRTVSPTKGRTVLGRPRVRKATADESKTIENHHVPYVTRAEWDEVQAILAGNRRTSKRQVLGKGQALLQGIIRCAMHGNRAMNTYYYSRLQKIRSFHRYICMGSYMEGGHQCCSIPGFHLDRAVADAIIARLRPPLIQVVHEAWKEAYADEASVQRRYQLESERAKRAVEDAKLRCMSVDPSLRSVLSEYEGMWEAAKRDLRLLEARTNHAHASVFTDDVWQDVLAIAENVENIWTAPSTTDRDRKEIARLLVEAVLIEERTRERIRARIIWADGAADTELEIRLPTYAHRLISEMIGTNTAPDEIARRLNDQGLVTNQGNPWRPESIVQLVRGWRKKDTRSFAAKVG